MSKPFPSLADAFLNYFDVDLVSSPEMASKAAGLRYRVYCEEFGFEERSAFPDHREADEFDRFSIQGLITHKRSSRAAGCVRLVCASETHKMPFEVHCMDSIYVDQLDTLSSERSQVCEFSRLAVDAAFRKRRGESHTRVGEFDALDCCHQEQRTFSMIGIAAFLTAFALACLSNRTRVFAMMEANLPRLLRQSGIEVQKVGDIIDYHGQRAAYFTTTQSALSGMRGDLRSLYEAIEGRVASGLDSEKVVAQRRI